MVTDIGYDSETTPAPQHDNTQSSEDEAGPPCLLLWRETLPPGCYLTVIAQHSTHICLTRDRRTRLDSQVTLGGITAPPILETSVLIEGFFVF